MSRPIVQQYAGRRITAAEHEKIGNRRVTARCQGAAGEVTCIGNGCRIGMEEAVSVIAKQFDRIVKDGEIVDAISVYISGGSAGRADDFARQTTRPISQSVRAGGQNQTALRAGPIGRPGIGQKESQPFR
jgi:hypothetical protein